MIWQLRVIVALPQVPEFQYLHNDSQKKSALGDLMPLFWTLKAPGMHVVLKRLHMLRGGERGNDYTFIMPALGRVVHKEPKTAMATWQDRAQQTNKQTNKCRKRASIRAGEMFQSEKSSVSGSMRI